MRSPLLTGLAVGLLLATAGCGGDEEQEGFSEDEQTVVDALTATMEGQEPEPFETKQWRCTAEGIVEEVGITELKKSGIVTENLESRLNRVRVNTSVATAIGDSFAECYDIDGMVAFQSAQHPDVPADAWDAYADCIDELRPQLRASVIEANSTEGGQKAQKAWNKAIATCNEELAAEAR